jgi:hypothetical protein
MVRKVPSQKRRMHMMFQTISTEIVEWYGRNKSKQTKVGKNSLHQEDLN